MAPPPDDPAHPTEPLDESLEELAEAFVTAARALVSLAVRSINSSPVEITLMQHRVLVLLASQGEQSVTALADALAVNASNASRVCDRLQKLDLVARRRSPSDARSVRVALTPGGFEVIRAVHEQRRREVERVLAALPQATAQATVEALQAFNDAAHEVPAADWAVVEWAASDGAPGQER